MNYWKIRVNNSRHSNHLLVHDVFYCTEQFLFEDQVAQAAVQDKMLIDDFLEKVDRVHKITRTEYLMYMWE